MQQIQYPIQTPEGDTIFVLGNRYDAGTDEWFAEKDRLQEIYRLSVEPEEVQFDAEGNATVITPPNPIDWGLIEGEGDE